MGELVQVGSFCPNRACVNFQRLGTGSIIRYGKTRQGEQRYQCKACGKTFSARTGTVFYRRRKPIQTVVEALAMLAEGMRIRSVARVKGVKADTVLRWLFSAASHALSVEAVLLEHYRLSACQIDALWTYVKRKKKSLERDGTVLGVYLARNEDATASRVWREYQ